MICRPLRAVCGSVCAIKKSFVYCGRKNFRPDYFLKTDKYKPEIYAE